MSEYLENNISYTSGIGISHMVVSCHSEPAIDDFDIQMLKSNPIPCLLKFDMQMLNGQTSFLYDISGMQSFEKLFEIRKLTFEDLKNFILALKKLSEALSEYLLSEDRVIFLEKCIFTGYGRDRYYFCYYPQDLPGSGQLKGSLPDLFNDFLSHIDYNDKKLVDLAFGLTRLCQSGSFSFADAAELLSDIDPRSVRSVMEEVEGEIQHSTETDPADSIYSGSQVPSQPVFAEHDRKKSNPKTQPKGTFRDKARQYFKGHDFAEIFDDINNARIIRKIKSEVVNDSGAPVSSELASADFPFFSADDISSTYEQYTMAPLSEAFMEDCPYMDSPEEDTMPLDMRPFTEKKLSGTGLSAGTDIPLPTFPFTIGKSKDSCDHVLEDNAISRIHLRLYENEETPGNYFVEDENSRNGSFLNGLKLEPYRKYPITSGDKLNLARCEFIFL